MSEVVLESEPVKSPLEFTGNWFIDAGILGFVNLMEEVYGWDLDELNKKISNNQNAVYWHYFPLAYVYSNLRNIQCNKLNTPKKEEIKTELGNIPKLEIIDSINPNEILEKVWTHIIQHSKKLFIELKLTSIDKKEEKKKENKVSTIEKLFNQKISGIKKEIKNNESTIKTSLNKKKNQKISYYEIEAIGGEPIAEKIKTLRVELGKWFDQPNEMDRFFRLPLSNKFFTNFLFFQPTWSSSKQKEAFKSILESNPDVDELRNIGKTINKLLLTQTDFNNEFYAPALPTIAFQQINCLFVYCLCFEFGFIKNYSSASLPQSFLFYSPSLHFSHRVNKKIRFIFGQQDNKIDILKLTLSQVIDCLYDYKSQWSLESMYIIQYDILDNQKQEGVEFIGIPKLQATIILDDTIRENLNKSIPFRKKGQGKFDYIWLLQELIKGKPLCPLILNHLSLCINGERYLSYNSSLYGLAVDVQLKKRGTGKSPFNQDFFKNYESVVDDIRKTASVMSLNKNCISDLFSDKDENKKLSYELLVAVKCKDKNCFLNAISKELVNRTGKGKEKLIELYLQNNIVQNDICWENYALPLIMGLVV